MENPIDALRKWYIENGEMEEMKIEYPMFFIENEENDAVKWISNFVKIVDAKKEN